MLYDKASLTRGCVNAIPFMPEEWIGTLRLRVRLCLFVGFVLVPNNANVLFQAAPAHARGTTLQIHSNKSIIINITKCPGDGKICK